MKTIKRRKLEKKTDYRGRLSLLKSGKPRLIVRKTNRYIIAQIVESDVAQDRVVFGANSKQLIGKGWPENEAGKLKNRTAAYLTGYLLGNEAKSKIKEAILDIGMNRNIKKSRIYAVLKGALDSGLVVPHSEEALPTIEEIGSKEKINKILEKIK